MSAIDKTEHNFSSFNVNLNNFNTPKFCHITFTGSKLKQEVIQIILPVFNHT